MTNENQREKISKLAFMSSMELAEMICSKDDEIVQLKELLEKYKESKTTVPADMGVKIGYEVEIKRLNNLIDTLKQGNQKLINTVAYQAMQLAGELNKNG